MQDFIAAHASHADPAQAMALVAAQVQAQRAARQMAFEPSLGWLYFTDHYAARAEALLADAQARWPGVSWVGAVGVGVAASGVEHFDTPALTLMLSDMPADDFCVFSGRKPLLPERAFAAQVHADGNTPDLSELLIEASGRTASGYLFGGLTASRSRSIHLADGVFKGGLSGVGFAQRVGLVSRVTQGCLPLSPPRRVTAADGNIVLTLDDEPALPLLLADLGVQLERRNAALTALRATLVGLTDGDGMALNRGGQFGADTRVRHLIGLDPARQAVAIGDVVLVGQQLTFCRRDREAARRDLVRICTEIRDEVETAVAMPSTVPADDAAASSQYSAEPPPGRIQGAVYVSCSGRGGPHFGGPSAEMQIVRHALGDVPLVGFFAGGEIARQHLYGYTGVLTVFTGRAG